MPDCLDCIDQAEDLRDLGPAMNASSTSPPGSTCAIRSDGSPGSDSTHDVERRADRAVVVAGPAHEGEHLAGRVALYPLAAADDPLCDRFAEFEPVLVLAFAPDQRDVGEQAVSSLSVVSAGPSGRRLLRLSTDAV
jgi:hypothetical protein